VFLNLGKKKEKKKKQCYWKFPWQHKENNILLVLGNQKNWDGLSRKKKKCVTSLYHSLSLPHLPPHFVLSKLLGKQET